MHERFPKRFRVFLALFLFHIIFCTAASSAMLCADNYHIRICSIPNLVKILVSMVAITVPDVSVVLIVVLYRLFRSHGELMQEYYTSGRMLVKMAEVCCNHSLNRDIIGLWRPF